MPFAAATLRDHHPRLRVRVVEAEPARCFELLVAEEADLALVMVTADSPSLSDGRFDQQPVLDDPLDLVVHAGHPLAAQKTVTLADAAREPWIIGTPGGAYHQLTVTACVAAGFTHTFVCLNQEGVIPAAWACHAGRGLASLGWPAGTTPHPPRSHTRPDRPTWASWEPACPVRKLLAWPPVRGFASPEFDLFCDLAHIHLVRPKRANTHADAPRTPAEKALLRARQWIGSIFQSLKDQLYRHHHSADVDPTRGGQKVVVGAAHPHRYVEYPVSCDIKPLQLFFGRGLGRPRAAGLDCEVVTPAFRICGDRISVA
jgi:DNA-binding transcriptional LysR family regulator